MYGIPVGHAENHRLRVKYMWRGRGLEEDFLRGDPGEGEPERRALILQGQRDSAQGRRKRCASEPDCP